MANSKRKFCLGAAILLLFCFQALAQESTQVQPASFLRANDRFAMSLLKVAHEQSEDRNIVIAPLPVSLTFAAILDGTGDPESVEELRTAFHWDKQIGTDVAGHMLLARFAKPKPYPASHNPPRNPNDPLLRQLRPRKPEELWLSGAFLYRGEGSLSQDFVDRVNYDFGFQFRAVGEHTSQSVILAKNWDPSLPMPTIVGSKPNDFWITTFTHLRTSWAGNTFVYAKREKHDFSVMSGGTVQADFLESEFYIYPYVRTEEFEAIVLSCWKTSILLVLPAANKDVGQLEAALAKDPNIIDAFLVTQPGDVQLPPFHFTYESDLRDSLEKLGVHRIFDNPATLLSMAPKREGGALRGVAQKTEITVDEDGIRADAGTIANGVYGGILGGAKAPFHMVLNRPFIFMIRDNVTNALLFAGAVMNPNLR
ncbi:MAG TPA: serpin family protein [Candidatus Acidoferrales bacterium]|nr:serpin family protein [Candidatus Acidoferrales bacterium]